MSKREKEKENKRTDPWPAVGESRRIVVKLTVHTFGTASGEDTGSDVVGKRGPIAHGGTTAVAVRQPSQSASHQIQYDQKVTYTGLRLDKIGFD